MDKTIREQIAELERLAEFGKRVLELVSEHGLDIATMDAYVAPKPRRKRRTHAEIMEAAKNAVANDHEVASQALPLVPAEPPRSAPRREL